MQSKDIIDAYEERKQKLSIWIHQHPLRQIQWEATRRCDMKCSHCGSSCSASIRDEELSETEIISAFKSITSVYDSNQLELVSITGGEPLLRSDLPRIISKLTEQGISHITLQTNGNQLCAKEGLLPTLVDAGLSGLGLNLDGLAESHDILRNQPGHFMKTVELVERVRSETSLYLSITTVVSQQNFLELPELAATIKRLKVPRWRLIELQPIGRAHTLNEKLLRPQDFRQLLDFVVETNALNSDGTRKPHTAVELGCTGWMGIDWEGIVRPYIWHCHAGIATLGIWSNGDIGGCTDIDHSRVEGNVRNDSIPEVWEKRFTSYRDFGSRRNGICVDCNQWDWCHGGGLHLRTCENELLHCPYALIHTR